MNEPSAPELHPRAPAGALIAASVLLIPLLLLTVGQVQLLNFGFGLWFTEIFVFFGVSWIIVRMSGRDPLRYPGLAPPRPAAGLYGFTLGVVNFFGVAIPILFLSQQFFPRSWVEAYDSARVFRDRTPVEMALIISGVIIPAALGEEYLFRGVLLRALTEMRVHIRWAIVITAIVFSAVHGDPVGFAARLELGLLFGWLYWRTGSLWPNMFAHAANNATTTALYFLSGAVAKGPEPVPEESVLAIVLYGALGIAALAALLRAPARWPGLLTPRVTEERPLPRSRFYRVAAPWFAGAAVALLLLFAFDRRGIALRLAEARHPLPDTLGDHGPERRELRELRRRARSGEVPVSEYESRLEEISRQRGERPPTSTAPSASPDLPSTR